LSALVFFVGLIVGSFLNVCIHRLPLGENIAFPGSHCPKCGAAIRWYQNVPVLSWLALRGRCASCRASIAWRYPLVELLSGAAALSLWTVYGPSPAFAIALPYAWMLLVLFFTDWDHHLLPDAITLTGFVAGMATAPFNPFLSGEGNWGRIWTALLGAALGSGILWGIGAVWKRLRGVDAMGLGDVKMMAMVGAFTGPTGVLFTLFVASIVGAVVGVARIPFRGGSLRDELPFGCFLAPAAMAAMPFARRAIDAYLALVGFGA
jgi:leader peptidase (prepilin peptidase)/N-methyltransferase